MIYCWRFFYLGLEGGRSDYLDERAASGYLAFEAYIIEGLGGD